MTEVEVVLNSFNNKIYGQPYFPEDVLVDMKLINEVGVVTALTTDVIEEIVDRIKKYVRENEADADEDINEFMFQTCFYRFDTKFNYDFSQKLESYEKHRILYEMVMLEYANAYDADIFLD